MIRLFVLKEKVKREAEHCCSLNVDVSLSTALWSNVCVAWMNRVALQSGRGGQQSPSRSQRLRSSLKLHVGVSDGVWMERVAALGMDGGALEV